MRMRVLVVVIGDESITQMQWTSFQGNCECILKDEHFARGVHRRNLTVSGVEHALEIIDTRRLDKTVSDQSSL